MKICTNCQTQLDENTAFCPVCGTRAEVNSSENASYGASSANFNFNMYRPPIIKQPNPKIEDFKNNLKEIFLNPGKAIDSELEKKNIFSALISGGILLISFVIMFLCIAGKADSEFGIDEFYGLGIIAAILCAAFFMIVPSTAVFISSKINQTQLNFVGALSANGLKTLYISAFLVITGFSALISIKIFAFMLLLTGMMNTFLSVSYINRANGNTLNSAKSLWATYGIYALLKIIATAIVYGILSSVIKSMIQEMISDFLWGSMF